jgi:hypothetical protein
MDSRNIRYIYACSHAKCGKRRVKNALVIVIRFLFILGWFVGDKVSTIEYFEACPKVTYKI